MQDPIDSNIHQGQSSNIDMNQTLLVSQIPKKSKNKKII